MVVWWQVGVVDLQGVNLSDVLHHERCLIWVPPAPNQVSADSLHVVQPGLEVVSNKGLWNCQDKQVHEMLPWIPVFSPLKGHQLFVGFWAYKPTCWIKYCQHVSLKLGSTFALPSQRDISLPLCLLSLNRPIHTEAQHSNQGGACMFQRDPSLLLSWNSTLQSEMQLGAVLILGFGEFDA